MVSVGAVVSEAMAQGSRPDPRAQIPYLLKQAVHVMQRVTDAALKDVDLNTAKYVVLRLLRERPDLSSAQLARRSFLSPQTMQAMIVNLERLGLVTRRQHPENARVSLTRLTEEGERAELAGREIIDRCSAAMVRDIPAEEQEQFVGLLRRAIEGMGDVELIDGVPHRNGVITAVGGRRRPAQDGSST
jgi:DNA-binding MarR family transcriptional regulator